MKITKYSVNGFKNLRTCTMIAVALSQPNPDPMVHTWTVITSGVTMGLLVFGFIGLFMRYLNSYNPVMRYITDASYWIYLMHLPFAIWIPGLLVSEEFGEETQN